MKQNLSHGGKLFKYFFHSDFTWVVYKVIGIRIKILIPIQRSIMGLESKFGKQIIYSTNQHLKEKFQN